MTEAEICACLSSDEKELTGWHVLGIMLSFFGVMFVVNGIFLFHAISSFPGEDVKKSYVQGLNFNSTLAARAAHAELGWHAEAGMVSDDLIVRLQDVDAQPLSNHFVVGELRRHATSQQDLAVNFQPAPGGEYIAKLDRLAPGRWLLRISVIDAETDKVLFRVEKTLSVA